MNRERIEAHGVRWSLQRCGDGPPLLLLHGFTGSSAAWEDVMDGLSGYSTCVAVDIVGHGDTDSPEEVAAYRMESVAAGLVEVMAKLGYQQFDVLGYSMGGRLALYLACTYPSAVRRLSLESASPGLREDHERAERRKHDEALADEIERHGVPVFVERWERLPLFATHVRAPASALERQLRIRRAQHPRGLANSLRGMGTGSQPSLWHQLHDVQMPVLLLTGADDAKFCRIADEMRAALPHAQHIVVPGAGHTIHLEQPAVYIEMLQQFLKSAKEGWS